MTFTEHSQRVTQLTNNKDDDIDIDNDIKHPQRRTFLGMGPLRHC